MIDPVVMVLGMAVLVVVLVIGTSVCLMEVCRPDEVLLVSGGFAPGFEVVQSGRMLRKWPFERVDRLDIGAREVDLDVTGVDSKDFVPLEMNVTATVKIGTDPRLVKNAALRLLDKGRGEVVEIAGGILGGTLQGVVANLTHEEVTEDRNRLAELVRQESEDALARLGLRVDSLNVAAA